MRDHDTAGRETTADQHGTTDRNETTDRPGAVDRPGVADRPGAPEQREAAGPHGAAEQRGTTGPRGTSEQRETTDPHRTTEQRGTAERRETADRGPVPAPTPTPTERSTATTTSTDASVTDSEDRKFAKSPTSATSPTSPAGTVAGESEARPGPLSGVAGRGDDEHVPDLLGRADGDAYRKRWREIQGRFVDDPREAVHSADELVADVMKTLAAAFADHKQTLEGQWGEGRDADTEALRVALREYRSFFNRLLTTSTPQH
ncbi:hypothetical protein [Streptomyces sp. NPDC096068]|uniref:hypothetical protein n=1 Tax=Streptomyces sp. NPDC096068 TaxID=3155424 RepID=UPI00331B896A